MFVCPGVRSNLECSPLFLATAVASGAALDFFALLRLGLGPLKLKVYFLGGLCVRVRASLHP